MNIVGVRLEMPSNTPIVLLQEDTGEGRMLPILIGQAEATAIALALEEVDTARPMTHDLIKDLLMVLGTTLDKVVVTDLRDKTFFAELHLSGPAGEQIVAPLSHQNAPDATIRAREIADDLIDMGNTIREAIIVKSLRGALGSADD